jgi:hypothetical protein
MGRLRLVRLVHGGLFGLAVVGAVLDISGLSFVGPTLAGGLSFSLVGLVLGMAFVHQGRPGGRSMLLAADSTIVIVAISAVGFALFDRPEPVTPVAIVLAIAAATAIIVVLIVGAPSSGARVARSAAHRALLLTLVVLGILSTVVPALSTGVLSGSYVLSLIGGFVPPLLIGIVAWWWGSGWPLALIGLSTLVTLANYAIAIAPGSVLPTSAILAVVSVVAGLRPPRLAASPQAEGATDAASNLGAVAAIAPAPDRETAPARPWAAGRATEPSAPPATIRPAASAVWALLGGALFLPSVLLGRFPPVLIDCFDCPPPSPLAEPSIPVDLFVALLVPIAATVLAVAPRSRPVANGSVSFVGLLGVVLILAQVGLGLAGTRPFDFMPAAAPASVLVGVAFLAAIVRPRWLAATGRLAALASGLAALIWMFVGIAGSFGIDLPLVKVSELVTGAILLVALAREAATEPEPLAGDAQLAVPDPS